MLGTCDIRWVYMLAVVGCADCFLLGLLALTLGWRQIIHTEEEEEGAPGYLVTNMGSIGPDIKTQAAIMHDRWERELFRLCRYLVLTHLTVIGGKIVKYLTAQFY